MKFPIDQLQVGHSPRLEGESELHIEVLAQVAEALPPIIVHRPTMKVIDGTHRLRAAQLRGDREIKVRFFDGDEAEAVVLAVEANIEHGLPLSLADRRAAALRIVRLRPEWSDRRIAASTGLSDKTIAAIRRSTSEVPQSNARVGRDGRVRSVDPAAGRLRASEELAQSPNAPLREVARLAGVSASTARDVRERMVRDQHPVPGERRGAGRSASSANRPAPGAGEPQRILQILMSDPILKLTGRGRKLLRWLDLHLADLGNRSELTNSVPAHLVPLVSKLLRCYIAELEKLAVELERRNARAM